jgi:transposase
LKIPHTAREGTDQINRRLAKGSLGGRRPDFDADLYKEHNTVERGFGRRKQWRGIASRCDKYAITDLGAHPLSIGALAAGNSTSSSNVAVTRIRRCALGGAGVPSRELT